MIALQAWIHCGVVRAHGIAILRDTLPLAQARARTMANWSDGCRVFDCDDTWLVVFPVARRLDCDSADGAPLVHYGALLSSLPLSNEEQNALCRQESAIPDRESPSHILWRRHGHLHCESIQALSEMDPATWIDVRSLRLQSASSLAPPPPDIKILEELESTDLRSSLGVGEADAERAEVLAALQTGSTKSPRSTGLWKRLGDWFARSRSLGSKQAQGAEKDVVPSTRTAAPSALNRLGAWWRMRLWSSRLGRTLGRRQGKYLSEVLALFENGDLEEAMRRAIPMSNEPSGVGAPPLGLPGRRADLSIQMQTSTAGATMLMEDDFFSAMRRQYRRALERLKEEGRIDEAAFILLELLKENDEGILFLESHDRFTMAAEVAESRSMAPARVVRQWLLAGNGERALRIARRHHAFAQAVPMLEVSHPDEAARLRLWWADWAACSGDYLTAVDAAWRVAPRLAKTWIDRGIAVGGVAAARLVVKKVELDPDSARGDSLRVVRSILADLSHTGYQARMALAQALMDAPQTVATNGIGRGLVRSLVRDLGQSTHRWQAKSVVEKLAKRFAPIEQADSPVLPKRQPSVATQNEQHYEIESSDRGAFDILDACLLPNGEILIALGESGCMLLRRDGSRRHHFREPTEQLILADSGNQVIGAIRRGGGYQLHKLNLETCRERRWIYVSVEQPEEQTFPSSYDGALLPFADGQSVSLLDAQEDAPVVLWRVGELGVQVHHIARSKGWLSILGRSPLVTDSYWESFVYALPELRLHQRQHHTLDRTSIAEEGGISPCGTVFVSYLHMSESRRGETLVWNGGDSSQIAPDRVARTVILSGDRCLVLRDRVDSSKVTLLAQQESHEVTVRMGGATQIRARVQCMLGSSHEIILLFDDLGRVLWFDSVVGEMLGSVRPQA